MRGTAAILGTRALVLSAMLVACGGHVEQQPASTSQSGASGGQGAGGGGTASGGQGAGVGGTASGGQGAGVGGLAECPGPTPCGAVRFATFPPSCDLPLRYPPDDPDLVTLSIDCEPKERDEEGAGWQFDSLGTLLTLKGFNCERVLAGTVQRLDVYYGCTGI